MLSQTAGAVRFLPCVNQAYAADARVSWTWLVGGPGLLLRVGGGSMHSGAALRPSVSEELGVALCQRVANDDAPGSAVAAPRQQGEVLGTAYRCSAVVHTQLGVDPAGVSPHGAQGHDELPGDVRPG